MGKRFSFQARPCGWNRPKPDTSLLDCFCGCGEKFIPKQSNQIFVNTEHRERDKNRRWPQVRLSSQALLGMASGNAQQAVTPGVAPHQLEAVRIQGAPQILPRGAKALEDLRTVDEIIRREKLLTPREVASVLGISLETLRSWRGKRYRRDLRFIKLAGARVRYRLRDLRRWLDNLGMSVKREIKEAE